MKILFIGGTGNISTSCVEELVRRGHEISILTRGNSPAPAGCRSIVADRHNAEEMNAALRDVPVDVVINFLGFTIPELEIDFDLFKSRVSQYIFISSTTVYAKPHTRLPLTEESPTGNAFSEYARDKLACEDWLKARHETDGFPVTIVRPSHTYSCRWIPNPVSSAGCTFAARLEQGKPVFVHDDGQSLWTLTTTADFSVALAGLVGAEMAVGDTFLVTSDEVLTWNQIYAEIARALGVDCPDIVKIPTDFICEVQPEMSAKLKGDKSEPAVFDNARIKRCVRDYACKTSFRDGIAESVNWFRADSARMTVDPAVDAIYENVIAAWREHGGSAAR